MEGQQKKKGSNSGWCPLIPPFVIPNCHRCRNNDCLWGIGEMADTISTAQATKFNQIEHSNSLETATAWNCDPQNLNQIRPRASCHTPDWLSVRRGWGWANYKFSYIIYLLLSPHFVLQLLSWHTHSSMRCRDRGALAQGQQAVRDQTSRPSSHRTDSISLRHISCNIPAL